MSLRSWFRSILSAPWVPDGYGAELPQRIEQARRDAIERHRREVERCDICSGRSRYLCPICRSEVNHTHENDYICETHSFVNPVRESDGARMSGDGWSHDPHVLAPHP